MRQNCLLTFLLFLFLALAVGFFCVAGLDNPEWIASRLGVSGAELPKYEVLKVLGIGMGGLLIAIQAVIANKRANAMVRTAKAQASATEEQAKANVNTEQGQRQERLKNAIEHLGHDKDSVRLGGAYELFHLARETRDLRQTVLEILCAHIRWTTAEGEYRAKHWSKPSEEVQNLLTLLFVQNHEVFTDFQVNLRETWLKGANLRSARLDKAVFTEAYLCGASLAGANLREVNLTKVRLQGADLSKARMERAILRKTRLQDACLRRVRLRQAQLHGTQMQGAKLVGARMEGADLMHVDMQGADLYAASLQLAFLAGVKLQAARLAGAQLQGAVLSGVYLGGVAFGPITSLIMRIRDRVGMSASLVGTIFQGGLTDREVASILEMEFDEDPNVLKAKLEPHLNQPESPELPEDSEVFTDPYTAEEAEQWIAEHEEAMSEAPEVQQPMSTLNWLTRNEDIQAAARVPYRLLEESTELSAGEAHARNLLIQGDNLEALKALLPFYAGRVRYVCSSVTPDARWSGSPATPRPRSKRCAADPTVRRCSTSFFWQQARAMPNDVQLSLGDYRFGLENAAYEQSRRAWAGRWVQQDVFVTRPFQQYLGPGHTGRVINGNVTPHFNGGLRQLGAMRAGAGRGEALQLVDSLGDVWRDFVITGITETRRGIGPAGLPFRIAFQMTMRSTEVNRQGRRG